jgi:peptidoglycan hydrolase-like protein with peptidoglycan-binding domain
MKTGIKNSIIALGFLGTFISFGGVVSAGYFNTTPVITCNQTITRVLQLGSQNSDVLTLQNYLSRAGYLQANPNGYFGYQTKRAVQTFQADNYIRVTGVVGEQTRNALNERLCDNSVSIYGDTMYGYNDGTTYVDGYDPHAIVVSPTPSTPAIYATPQINTGTSYVQNTQNVSTYNGALSTGGIAVSGTASAAPYIPGNLAPATSQVQGSSIVYSPGVGYVVALTQVPQSLTINTPRSNAVYNEGDTVYLTWSTSNLNAKQYAILLENKSTRVSRTVAVTGASASLNNASFVLSKGLLDDLCSGSCDANQQGQFSIVITTPVTDIAGITTTFRAGVSPIVIKRPLSGYGISGVTMTTKNPVSSSEAFRLYINLPGGYAGNTSIYNSYSFRVRATCPQGVQIYIGGVTCGQDFVIPSGTGFFQPELPVTVNNTTWFNQEVVFDLVIVDQRGYVVGQAQTKTTVNGAPNSC